MDTSGVWFGRCLGLWMSTVTMSPYTIGMPKSLMAKLYIVPNVFFMFLFVQASFFLETTGPGRNAVLPVNMWWTQLPVAATLLAWNVKALQEGGKKD